MDDINQGTVIYGIRSEKYPEKMCYAIIISARCDIANAKILKLYYLTAVNAGEWFCTEHGFTEVYRNWIDTKKKNFRNNHRNYPLNFDILYELPYNQAVQILAKNESNEKKKTKLIENYTELYKLITPDLNINSKRKIVKDNPDPAIRFLKDITSGHIFHYFFLPQNVYTDGKKRSDGLIIDLQEIGIMSMKDVKRLKSPGIDYKTLSEESEREQDRLLKSYWLVNDDDFVGIDGVVKSPWCELLMQRFANDFIRIGVDGATENDYKELINAI